MEKKTSIISELSSSTKEAQIKDVRHIEEVDKSIKFIKMGKDRKEKERQISEQINEIKTLNEKVEIMD